MGITNYKNPIFQIHKAIKTKHTLFILILLFTSLSYSQDICIGDSLIQKVSAENINHIFIECYCPNNINIKGTSKKEIRIDVYGKVKSVGFHGDQGSPSEINKETLSFKTELKNDTIKLISKESIFMHHSYLIEDLQIIIPEKTTYQITRIHVNNLRGRRIN